MRIIVASGAAIPGIAKVVGQVVFIDEWSEFTEEQQRYIAAAYGISSEAPPHPPPDLGDVFKDEAPPVKGPTLPRQLPHQNKRRSLPPRR